MGGKLDARDDRAPRVRPGRSPRAWGTAAAARSRRPCFWGGGRGRGRGRASSPVRSPTRRTSLAALYHATPPNPMVPRRSRYGPGRRGGNGRAPSTVVFSRGRNPPSRATHPVPATLGVRHLDPAPTSEIRSHLLFLDPLTSEGVPWSQIWDMIPCLSANPPPNSERRRSLTRGEGT